MLPNFLVLGTSRGGTTFIKRILEQHPDIFMGSQGVYTGDIHFFNNAHAVGKWQNGIEWYEKFFKDTGGAKMIGQKSGLYFSDVQAPELIKKTLGENIKFIVTLRCPMECAYSSYWYQIEDIPIGTPFRKAIEMEQSGQLKMNSPLINPGMYYPHLTNYLKHFTIDQFHFILHDDIKAKPLEEIKKAYRFLGVDENFTPEDYDQKVNQAIGKGSMTYQLKHSWGLIKKNFPVLYNHIKELTIAKKLRAWLGKSSEKVASKQGYPEISIDDWQYLERLYYESDKKVGAMLSLDLISLWHKPPSRLKANKKI